MTDQPHPLDEVKQVLEAAGVPKDKSLKATVAVFRAFSPVLSDIGKEMFKVGCVAGIDVAQTYFAKMDLDHDEWTKVQTRLEQVKRDFPAQYVDEVWAEQEQVFRGVIDILGDLL